MQTLIHAAYSWSSSRATEDRPTSAEADAPQQSDLCTLYKARLAASRTRDCERTLKRFLDLLREFGDGGAAAPPADGVLDIDGTRLVFAPMAVTPGNHRAHQQQCFRELVRYWHTHEHVDELVIDLTAATHERVGAIMRGGVSVQDVLRGARIWETLPCRIRSIVVLEPGHATLAWIVRRTAKSIAPRKVLRKTRFVATPREHDVPRAQERQHDGDADVGAVGRHADVA